MVHTVLTRGGAAFAVFRLPSTLLLCIVVLGKVAVVPVSARTGVLAQTVSNTVWFSGAVRGQGLHARRVQPQVYWPRQCRTLSGGIQVQFLDKVFDLPVGVQ